MIRKSALLSAGPENLLFLYRRSEIKFTLSTKVGHYLIKVASNLLDLPELRHPDERLGSSLRVLATRRSPQRRIGSPALGEFTSPWW